MGPRSSGRSAGDTTAPAASLIGGATARIQQLHVVYLPDLRRDRAAEPLGKVTVEEGLTVGRQPAGARCFTLDDPRMSRTHARLTRDPTTGDVEITDCGSRHGTFVDGRRVDRSPLVHGSVVRLGQSVLVFADTVLRIDDAKALAPESPSLRGTSLAMQRVRGEIGRVATSALPVLVLGETGVGKERVAEEIHRQSGRAGMFVAVNCAAIAPALAESELFGHTMGAFTGATQRHDGLFVAADRGTLFLDEIAELPGALQPKLLRTLANGEVRAVGRSDSRRVDVRVVAATHGDLDAAMGDGGFRADLLARLSGWTLRVPPLRERREDVLTLARTFLRRAGADGAMTASCAEALAIYGWRFNVRELEQVIAATAVRAAGAVLGPEHLPEHVAQSVLGRATTGEPSEPPLAALLASVPPDTVPDAADLRRVASALRGNVAQIAAYFQKDRKQISRWADKLGVDLDALRGSDPP